MIDTRRSLRGQRLRVLLEASRVRVRELSRVRGTDILLKGSVAQPAGQSSGALFLSM